MIGGILSVLLQWILYLSIPCLLAVCGYLYNSYSYWKRRGVPYEKPFLFFGNLSFAMRKSFWDFCYELKDKHPREYIGIFLAWRPALVVQTPELAKQIIVRDHDSFKDRFLYSGKSDPLGNLNLFSLKSPTWQAMRHEISPMFTAARLKSLTQVMNKNSGHLVEKIQRDFVDYKKPVHLKEILSMYTSDTLAYSGFGIEVSALSGQNSPVWAIANHIVKWTFWRGLEFTLMFVIPAVAAFAKLSFFSATGTEYTKKLFWNLAEERKISGKSTDKDLVSLLLRAKENSKLPDGGDPEVGDNLMLAQAAFFVFGTIVTSSTTMAYVLHELSYHHEEQEKLYYEINEAIKRSGKDVLEYDELMELKYLTACINETLRKYPPVPYLDRIANEKYKLNDKVTIDKGTPVFVNLLAIHYDKNVFPEPEEWRPDRMIGTSDNDNLNFSFLPFGDGPRYCIGKRYGLMQVRTAIAQIIHKYKVRPVSPYCNTTDSFSVILAPSDGGRVKFIPR